MVLAIMLGALPTTAGGATPDRGSSSSPLLTERALAAGASHDCIVGGSGRPVVDWTKLRNPVLAEPSGGVKDQAIIWANGQWHMLFSYVIDDASFPGGIRWNVATATSKDMVHWSPPDPWPLQRGVLGVASPDIVREPSGTFLVSYQSDPGSSAPSLDQARLFYRTS